jgi:succinate-semialdehyde dehydrogenase/glutarate-semialdehyde dehydrogenase
MTLTGELFIGGEWVPASDGGRVDVADPATNEQIASVASATAGDVDSAISSAEGARRAWAERPAGERGAALAAWATQLETHGEELAALLTMEQGKPIAEARAEIAYSTRFVRYYAEEARRAYGEVIPFNRSGRRLFTTRQPVGVVAAITPWNFPVLMIARKVAPALAAGCGVVLKPASETPLSALALAELACRSALPRGVLNVVHGDPVVVGKVLTSDQRVRMLTFTGSTEIGRLLMAQCASTVKQLALELGGNAPFIVFDDADLDAAVAGAIVAKFANSGQTCVCANRIFVQQGIYGAFAERFAAAVSELVTGPGLDPEVVIGPLIDAAAMAKVDEHVRDARARGASVVVGGGQHRLGGTYYAPTVLVEANASMALASEETFGPVAPLFRFDDENEVVKIANATESGLAAYFFTRDLGRAVRVAEALEFGVIGVNTGSISYEGAPFGGMKQSGLGREGSIHGLEAFLEMKYVCVDGI